MNQSVKKKNKKINTEWFFNKKLYVTKNDVGFYEWFQITKKDIFSLKAILIKIFIFLLCAVILVPISLHLQAWALSISYNQMISDSNSIVGVEPIGNPGIEFSFLSNTPVWVVFFAESITIILASICLIIITAKPWFIIPVSFCLIGGIMNANSRASIHEYVEGSWYQYQHDLFPNSSNYKKHDVVIDYWYFHTGKDYAIFNFNDTCVISGAIGFIFFILLTFIYTYFWPTKK